MNCRCVETRNFDLELPSVGLVTRSDGVNHNATRSGCIAWIGYLGMLDRRFVIATIAHVSLNLVGVLFDRGN